MQFCAPSTATQSIENFRFAIPMNKASVAASGNVMSLFYPLDELYLKSRAFPDGQALQKLFYNCSITSAPLLPATTLVYGCYSYMFSGCTGLTKALELPATKLATYCYSYMFYGCTGLTEAPALPAETLASSCYYQLFSNCTGLTAAPELPATKLAAYCYYWMFYGCSNLSSVTVGFSSFDTSNSSTNDWLNGTASTGTFYCTDPSAFGSVDRGTSTIPEGWENKQKPTAGE